MKSSKKKKRRMLFRRKRSLDPTIKIDYKDPEQLKRFITDRGKIIPRRISGATSAQQRQICKSIKQARYLALLHFSVAHRQEKRVVADAALAAASAAMRASRPVPGMRPPPSQDRAPETEGTPETKPEGQE